ncbi:ferrochelatase [uncultured Amaricoccus sp.]|uniref:ferrochelatase n=1 Tax=uncultured Amaricoccus sp. TaxID=339341 RepID=UPI00262DA5D5|nr:ferrochelatase [uncultured Amaricoccus sp.]
MDSAPFQTTPDAARPAFSGLEHPKLSPARVGVVLSNLGTPDATNYWSMRRYLSEFLSDRRVIDYSPLFWQPLLQLVILTRRPFTSGRNYASIWNTEQDESPLLITTRGQAAAVAERARAAYGDRVLVDFAMRYGNPSTASVITGLRERGCERIVFFPLYPQYSAPTTATANDEAFRTLMAMKWQPSLRTVPAYHDDPLYIEALAQSVERIYAGLDRRPDLLVTSYHGMPERYLAEGDPYHCQCRKTTRLLHDRLGFAEGEVVVTFQSRFGPEEWLKPYTVEEVARLARAGKKRIAVMAPAFSSDCVETLEEINGEIRHAFEAAGGEEFVYVPCLNEDTAHIDMMMSILGRELAGWV